jgi:endonuclease/exonuclease/phosphatase family metal-dependent hydrolase
VCIPWREAHVRTGTRDRRPWQDHLVYLHGLGPVLASRDPSLPTLVLGDFNQRIPRARAPEHVAHALTGALGGFVVATAGEVPGVDRQSIDHIAHSPGIEVGDIAGFDRRGADGRRLSDHDAVRLVITGLRRG